MTKILAIDDNLDNLIVIKAVLDTAMKDLTILTATSGRKGIEVAKAQGPDVIILDLIMPDLDGFETCRIIKEDPALSRIPVIILTALQTDASSRIRALKLGAEAFLAKPVDESELVAQVTSMLRIKRSEDKLRRDNENLEDIVRLRTQELQLELLKREAAEKTLIASEERFRLIVKNSSDILVILDRDGNQRYISPAAELITGYSLEDLIDKPFNEVIHPEDIDRVLQIWSEAVENPGKLLTGQYRHVHKTRQWVWLEAVGQSFLNEPSVNGVILSVRDISKRLEAERAERAAADIQRIQYNIAHAMVTARDQNELYEVVRRELSTVMDTRNFYLAFFDEQTNQLIAPFEKDQFGSVNEHWSAENSLTGLVIRQKKSLLLTKADIKELADSGEIVLRGNRAEIWVGVPLKNSGKVTAVLVLQSYDNPAAYDKKSIEILEIIANQLNIYSEKKRVEENEKKLSTALVQSPVSILITNKEGVIEYVNPKICEITGYEPYELIGRNPRIFQSGRTLLETYNDLWTAVTSGSEWSGEFQNKKKNGEFFWESVSITPIMDQDGNITNYLAVKEDITERKRTFEELEEAKKRAEASDRLKSAFLENISHEIRTPLNGILGFAPLVIDPNVSDDEKYEYLEILNVSGKRLIQTVTDYMDISLLASGNMKTHIKPFQLNRLIAEVEQVVFSKCSLKNISFQTQLTEQHRNITLNTDKELLKKIFFHLLDNAVKFTENGIVKLSCRVESGNLVFMVSDSGVGISEAALPMVFDKFFQEETKLTRSHEGSGLGLTIVSEILKLLHGKISVESVKFQGAVFTFSIPYLNEEPVVTKAEMEVNQLKKDFRKVVIAEDDEDNFYFLKVSLRNEKFEILRARNGREAVELCESHPVSLVLMDLKMPEMDGYEATRRIKQMYRELPVIAVTAYAMTGDEQKTEDAGCDGYIPKPFTREQILNAIRQFLPV